MFIKVKNNRQKYAQQTKQQEVSLDRLAGFLN